jgi:hypothetical protein
MKKFLILTAAFLFVTNFGFAQKNGEKGERIKALWVAFITQELDLSADESAKFWPIYNEYTETERDLMKSKRKLSRKPISEMSDAEMEAQFNQSLNIDEKIIALKRSYYPKLKTAIPASKIAKLPAAEREFKKKIIRFIQERRNK